MRAWLPGVPALPSSHDGGSMTGSDPYWVWHSYEAPYQLTALQGAMSLIRAGNEVHFTFHPITGDIVQILPANRAGRGLVNRPGGVQTNRQGRCCIQVEVIAYAKRPWTSDLTAAGRRGLAKLMAYAAELGVPARWPAGPPPAYPSGHDARSVAVWNGPGGHFSHSEVPENSHGDPGAIDTATLFDVLEEDDMPLTDEEKAEVAQLTVDRLLSARLKNSHNDIEASFAAWVVYGNEKAGDARDNSANCLAAINLLRDQYGPQAISDAVRAGLADGTIKVDITVNGAQS